MTDKEIKESLKAQLNPNEVIVRVVRRAAIILDSLVGEEIHGKNADKISEKLTKIDLLMQDVIKLSRQ